MERLYQTVVSIIIIFNACTCSTFLDTDGLSTRLAFLKMQKPFRYLRVIYVSVPAVYASTPKVIGDASGLPRCLRHNTNSS